MVITSLSSESQGADRINYRTVHLMSKNYPAMNLILGSDKNLLTTSLGQPPTINHLDWATLTEDVDEYIYNGSNSIYIGVSNTANNFLWGYLLHTADLYVSYNANSIKIGDNINNVIRSQFPISYLMKRNNSISVSLSTDNGDISDSFLYFLYDNNDLITEIGIISH